MAKNIVSMRAEVASVYPTVSWKARVSMMPERQVIAIYHNFKNRGYFDGKRKKPVVVNNDGSTYEQLTIFDFMEGGLYEQKRTV